MRHKARIPKNINVAIQPNAPFEVRWLADEAKFVQPYTDLKLASRAKKALVASGFDVVLVDMERHQVIDGDD